MRLLIFNKRNTPYFETTGLRTWLLVAESTTNNSNVSMSLTELDVNGIQPIHSHEPEQCLFIVEGKALVTVGEENQEVRKDDTIFVPSNFKHGIRNVGASKLIYITASGPVFGLDYERRLWPFLPEHEA